MSEFWSEKEIKELEKYFNSSMADLTLYQRIHKINSDRSFAGVIRKLSRMRESGWERNKDKALKKLRVGYLDIETTNLNADFGFILSWFIKKDGKNEYDSSIIKKSEIFNYTFDKRVVKELLEALKKYDVIYTHYGSDRRFDLPYVRTRAYANDLEGELPKNMEKFIMDTYPIARNKLKLHSNRLGSIAEALGIEHVKKTPLSGRTWVLAAVGHPQSLKYIFEHNRKDVMVLEAVCHKLKAVEKPIYRGM